MIYLFNRRTPRALNFHASVQRPLIARRARKAGYTLSWKNLPDDHDLRIHAATFMGTMKAFTDRSTLETDYASAVAAYQDRAADHGLRIRLHAATAQVPEHVTMERV